MMLPSKFWSGSCSKGVLFSVLSVGLLSSCIHKKYDTPITKDTQQPDKVLFDAAMKDIEHGRYEIARISLQTLMNTYESSEYLAKAKLAIADSWYREGGGNGLAQAEAEYKDFELFYPQMEESAEAQNRICQIHMNQMDKSDRDPTQALRAQEECKTLLVQYPNSKFAPQAAQRLRNIQESLAEHEFVVGDFYWRREMNPAAANRLDALVDQFPLYSKCDEALFEAGDAYSKMGPRYRAKAGEMFARIVRDYPLGRFTDQATDRLKDMELPVPTPDKAAYDRMKYDQENYKKPGIMAHTMGFLTSRPDVSHAAKMGNPTMTDPKPTIPVSVPLPANPDAGTETSTASSTTPGGGANGTTDVTATKIDGPSALDTKQDARSSGGAAQPDQPATTTQTPQQPAAPLPTNRDAELAKLRKKQAKQQDKLAKKKKKNQDQSQPAAAPQPAAAQQQPPATTTEPQPAQTSPAPPPNQ
jgi:outer membrane protein assembly factor BamD